MAKLIFRLRNVPEDEADDIRQLLSDNAIDFYETTAGNWGISMPGLWLNDESQAGDAKSLIDNYQQERAVQARQAYQQSRESRDRTGWVSSLFKQPLKLLMIIFCLVIIYFSIKPFFSL